MAKNKNNWSVWDSRISKKSSGIFDKIGSSLPVDKRLFKEDILTSIAHVEMLYAQKIISFKIKNKIVFGLNKIKREIINKKYNFNLKHEDIHMSIENRLFEIIGDDAGYLHTARSRNDLVITDLKIWIRENSIYIKNLLKSTKLNLIKIAEKNIYTIMPGFTHLKVAQPVSFAHYILAYIEIFNRDIKKFENILLSVSENPLGAGALSGTSFNIDRNYTSKKLKFNKPTRNSIDTVSDRDFVIDFLYSCSMCSMHISRLSEEFIIWNSDGFNLLSLKDRVLTGSSIMPQKKNPDPLEFLRGQTGSLYGGLISMLTILKGLPLSYFKDLQDDKKYVFTASDTLKDCINVMNEILNNIIINKKKMLQFTEIGFITATDLADYFVKELKYPFRKSYNVTAKLINYCEKKNKKFEDLTIKELNKIDKRINKKIFSIFDVYNSIKSKKSFGGTSFDNVKRMIKTYKKELK